MTTDIHHPAKPEAEYLRPAAMAKALGIGKTSLYQLAKRPGFPGSVNLSSRHRLFPKAAVLSWMAAQAQGMAA